MQIKANGIRMNYELSGKKGAPVVVLSHSLSCNLLMWNPQMDALNPYFQALRYEPAATALPTPLRVHTPWSFWRRMSSVYWTPWIWIECTLLGCRWGG